MPGNGRISIKKTHEVQQEKHQVSQRTFPKGRSEKELVGWAGVHAWLFDGAGSAYLQPGPSPTWTSGPSRGSHLASLGLLPLHRCTPRTAQRPRRSLPEPILAAGPRRASGEARAGGIKAPGRAPPPQAKSNHLQPEPREPREPREPGAHGGGGGSCGGGSCGGGSCGGGGGGGWPRADLCGAWRGCVCGGGGGGGALPASAAGTR